MFASSAAVRCALRRFRPPSTMVNSEAARKTEKRWIATRRSSSAGGAAAGDPKLNLFVSCLPGLEHVLSAELRALNIPHTKTVGGANLRDASVRQILQCHLYLGTASHVLIRCGRAFRARSFAELRRKVAKIPWSDWLMEDSHIVDIRVSASKSKLYHTGAIAERIQKAIDESLGREQQDSTNESIDAGERVQLTVRVVKDFVQISIDTSETPLHQRGYRLQTAKAPLREDIAFAMLYCSGWKPRYKGENEENDLLYGGLLDPFCGSGTILIEAASMLKGLPPGRMRPTPALSGTRLFDPLQWEALPTEETKTLPFKSESDIFILGSDRDDGAVAAAASNADRAGVGDLIEFSGAALACSAWLEDPSLAPDAPLIVTNPPFGKRIKGKGATDPLLPLYQTLGDRVTKLCDARGGNATILAHDVKLARRMAVPLQSLFSTHHGGIEVSALSTIAKDERTDEL